MKSFKRILMNDHALYQVVRNSIYIPYMKSIRLINSGSMWTYASELVCFMLSEPYMFGFYFMFWLSYSRLLFFAHCVVGTGNRIKNKENWR